MRHAATMLLCAVAAGQAAAQVDRDLVKRSFERLDEDGDGRLTREEFPGSDRQYQAMDRNRDKAVTLEEYSGSEIARRLVSASYRNRNEPRPRTTAAELAEQRLQWLSRFDGNRDGRITRQEWTGSSQAFATLDLDNDGIVDRNDLATAAAAAAETREPPLPDDAYRLPGVDELLERLDRDRNGALSMREAARDRTLPRVFERADTNRDEELDREELTRLLDSVRERMQKRERERARPVPYKIPFSAWDKNDDGRLEQNEFLERRYLFARIDRNRDAAVTRDEVERYELMVTGDDFVERFDLDGNGRVTLEEFGGPPDAFRRADRNGDGSVTRADR